MDACEAAWGRQIEELKAKVDELEAALERKAEATTEAPKEEGSRMPASCVLPESADSCCRRSRRSRTRSPKERTVYQRPSGSSPEPSDRFDRNH
jgi:hypothetical protein